jgi:light-regulated signal transduction histidine kinase (bacteriophytochrome)
MTTTTPSGQPAVGTTTVPDIPYLKFGEAVTLTNCDREPIHVPGHAQAHGAVVVLDPGSDGLVILQASANVESFCGLRAEDIVGQEAFVLFNADQLTILRSAVASGRLEANPLYLFTGPVHGPNVFHATAHTFQGVLTVELERVEEAGKPTGATFPRAEPQTQLKQAIARLRRATTLAEYGHAVCESVQEISGFDRVMLYKFHEDGHGEVISEVVGESDTREPYLGLHYPESDIPKQARALYLLNGIRLMPDAQYEPAPILPTLNPLTGRPLDMTHCVLRGYSRMYTEYLTNMGARASMSLAILKDGALWGLVACHHQTYRWIPYDVRTACEFLADVVSLQIAEKEAQGDAGYRERMRDAHQHLVENMARHGEILNGLTRDPMTVLSLIESGGGAVLIDDDCRLLGNTPPEDEVRGIVRWLNETRDAAEELWSTDALPAIYAPAEPRKDRVAGLLALRVTKAPPPGTGCSGSGRR